MAIADGSRGSQRIETTEKEYVVPACALELDGKRPHRGVHADYIERAAAQNGDIARPIILAVACRVFAERDVEFPDPMIAGSLTFPVVSPEAFSVRGLRRIAWRRASRMGMAATVRRLQCSASAVKTLPFNADQPKPLKGRHRAPCRDRRSRGRV